MSNENAIALKSINDILECDFHIPSYQRGYRWTKTQVNDLLNDIWDFIQEKDKPKDEFYCLQPIVVSLREGKYIVIDGQQRLTTIRIILSYLHKIVEMLDKRPFTIEYETRKGSESFLKEIDYKKKDENIDYYHMCQAHEVISNWFANKDGGIRIDFLKTLLGNDSRGNDVKIIWYEVNEGTDHIDIFTRINMGKIPLTPSELIKALFLLKNNFKGEEETKRLRQLEIAGEWDRIEYALRNDEFWYFLQDGSNDYDNRIEFIFDLMSEKKGNDKDFTFRYFYQRFNETKDIETAWNEIKKYFLTFQEWFTNREYYHLIGYLIAVGEDINEIKKESTSKTKSYVNYQVAELNYEDDASKIRKVLLLFNIITLSANINSNIRFQFDRFKEENWDIEHIHSVQSAIPTTNKHQDDWLNEVLKFSDNQQLKIRITNFLDTPINKREEFDLLYTEIVKEYSEHKQIEDINDISNLALLDAGTNRGYKNAVFPIKRKIIIEKDQKGTFIPVCTKNAFLKYYNGAVEQMTFWGAVDRTAYKEAIISTLNPYLPNQILNSND